MLIPVRAWFRVSFRMSGISGTQIQKNGEHDERYFRFSKISYDRVTSTNSWHTYTSLGMQVVYSVAHDTHAF